MARLALFIDGGYMDALQRKSGRYVDYSLLCREATSLVAAKTEEPIDLLRAYYYHCLPYQSSEPSPEEAKYYAKKRRFFDALRRITCFEVREGRLAFVGTDNNGKPIY